MVGLIEGEKWDEISRILSLCPEQVYIYQSIIEEKIQNSKYINEFPVVKIIYENGHQENPDAPFVYYKFTECLNSIFGMLDYKEDFLTTHTKEKLCKIWYPKITEFLKDKRNRISSIEKFSITFFNEIQKNFDEDLINQYFLRDYLNKENPEVLLQYFPDLISKGFFQLGYELLLKFNDLIEEYPEEVKLILENIIIYEKQYYSLKELLRTKHEDYIEIMESNRKRLKSEFYNRFINYEEDSIDKKLYGRNPDDIFRYTFDLFSDNELLIIIRKIINLKINYSHFGTQTSYHNWIHIVLLEIAWVRKSYLFSDFLEDLVELGYLQVVQTYFNHFPEKIKMYQDYIFDKLGSFSIDLLKWHFNNFKLDDLSIIFQKLLTCEVSMETLTSIFFDNLPEFISQFKEIIKEYIYFTTKDITVERSIYYKLDSLLRIYYRSYQNYDHIIDDDFNLLKDTYEFFISHSFFKEEDFYIHNLTLANHYNVLEESLQKELIKQLIDSKNLSSISFLLSHGYRHIGCYLNLILTFEPRHHLQSEHFIRVLDEIVRKSGINNAITENIKSLLEDQTLSHKTAEIYSFLGDFERSEQVIKKLLDDEVIIPYSINAFIDYQLTQIEKSILISSPFNASERIEELEQIERDFNLINTNPKLVPNFKFKQSSYKARMYLYEGISNLQNGFLQRSRSYFENASMIYKDLRNTKIKLDTKKIFNAFYKVSEFFSTYLPDISSFKSSDELNNLLQNKLIKPLSEQISVNAQMNRFLLNLNQLSFGTNLKLNSQLLCEIPTKFCPIPPEIISKRLIEKKVDKEEVLLEWDKNNQQTQEGLIFLSDYFDRYSLILEFREKSKFFDFNISFNNNSNVVIQCEDKTIHAGKIIYELLIRSEAFNGEQNIDLIFTEKDICGYPISSSFVIKHSRMQKIEDDLIVEINTEITTYKQEIYTPYHFQKFLDQFKDPEIRYTFLKNILYRVKDYYYTSGDITRRLIEQLKCLPFKDDDRIIFIVLNELSKKSQGFWSYFLKHYSNFITHNIEIKKSNELLKYLSKYKAQHRVFIVFIDDVIGTGRQFIKFYKNNFQNRYEKLKIQKSPKFRFYLIAGIGSEQSFDYISDNSILSESHIRYSVIIRENEKALNKKNWDNKEELEKVKEFLKIKHPLRWGGYKTEEMEEGLEYLVVLEWNTPNNTIGCLYKKNENWNPLFPRS